MDDVVYIGHRVPARESARMHGVVRKLDRGDYNACPQHLEYTDGVVTYDWGVSTIAPGAIVLAKSILVHATDDPAAANDEDLVTEFVEEFVSRFAYGSWTLRRLTIRRWMRGRLMEMESDNEGGQHDMGETNRKD